ncbi:TPA: response regulator [Klebsiella pneumoniae]|uniref:response regulator n=1 Tax=Klebsiella TaxID=570 RepID=UPI001F111F18|nr:MULTISPECIES: response regulator [Klebsiella]EKZ6052478.1 response regulator [Klebsiella variicola]HCB1240046.1 response regulator [Klebsiella quasipneumoniae subsp. quasipneumoniae]MDK1755130.1 response regulator [Klebsiella sp. K5-322]MDK1839670.1 response regulator [Klebsiella sp. K5-204]HBR2004614.1 response regulator [Klebsiella pneumoniae]
MKKILILDDEPMFLDWIEDFTNSLGFSVKFITSVNDAYEEINNAKIDEYSALVLDLNVPVSPELEALLKQKQNVFQEFRGLFIAQQARTKGISGRKIIVYSVHDNAEVEEICKRLDVSYIPKGRAKVLKDKLQSILLLS